MSRPKSLTLPLFILAILAGVAGVWIARQAAPERSPVQKLVLAAETIPSASPVWIAENKGYFREEGLDVTIREFESGRTALRTMLSEKGIDIATAAQTPVISNSFHRNDYAIFAGMVYSDEDVQMLARRDRGIQMPGDLRGKTIGITGGSSGHFFLGLFLALHRLQLSDVKTVDIEATQLPTALIEGRVDAIVTWEPHIHRARKALADNAMLMPSRNLYREDFYFIARKDFIRKHSDALARFLRAVEKGQQFISENRPEAIDIVQRRLKIDKEILDDTWDDLRFRLFLDQSMLVSLEDEARWAIVNKLTDATKIPNFLDYVDADVLRAIKPGAVMLAGTQAGVVRP